MIAAQVEGRPMPCSSSRRTSPASVWRSRRRGDMAFGAHRRAPSPASPGAQCRQIAAASAAVVDRIARVLPLALPADGNGRRRPWPCLRRRARPRRPRRPARCAPGRPAPRPSGSPARGARSGRRAPPRRGRDGGRPLPASARSPSAGSPHGPPARCAPPDGYASPGRSAAGPARSRRRSAPRSTARAWATAVPRHRGRIGARIGDQPRGLGAEVDALVEPLGDRHGLADPEAEPAERRQLQGRGRERRVGRPVQGVPLDGDCPQRRLADTQGGLPRRRFGSSIPASPIAVPSSRTSVAAKPNAVLPAAASASTVQYRRGTKASIPASRSQIRRSATDCTRPAERQPGSLRHSTGDRP